LDQRASPQSEHSQPTSLPSSGGLRDGEHAKGATDLVRIVMFHVEQLLCGSPYAR